jgi:hypothetical protein
VSGLTPWSPGMTPESSYGHSAMQNAGRSDDSCGHPAMALDHSTGKKVEKEPRWSRLPTDVVGIVPLDTVLDSWVHDAQTLKARDGTYRRELRAWRLSPVLFVRIVAVQALVPRKDGKLATAGPWAASGTALDLSPVDRVDVPALSGVHGRSESNRWSGLASPEPPADLEAVVAAAPLACKVLLPESPNWSETWGIAGSTGTYSWGQVALNTTRLGWMRGDNSGWTAGAWIIRNQRVIRIGEATFTAEIAADQHPSCRYAGRAGLSKSGQADRLSAS